GAGRTDQPARHRAAAEDAATGSLPGRRRLRDRHGQGDKTRHARDRQGTRERVQPRAPALTKRLLVLAAALLALALAGTAATDASAAQSAVQKLFRTKLLASSQVTHSVKVTLKKGGFV